MEIIKKIIEPKFDRESFYKTNEKEIDFQFSCDDCGKEIIISSIAQINNNWIGKTDLITDYDFNFLKEFYKIGLNNKSYDGGFSVFDKLTCSKCESKYISYCGVKEFSNSAYLITLNGLLKIESANLFASIRNSIIDLLDLLSDFNKQLEYAKAVGDVVAIQEMICMWFDDTYHPNSSNFIKAFSYSELQGLKGFNDYYNSISSKLPDKDIKILQIDTKWETLARFANRLKNVLKNAT
jgi:transcription elongation factor Elf1